jgi:hypothetical protein
VQAARSAFIHAAAASACRIAKPIIPIFFGASFTSRFAGAFIHVSIGWWLEEVAVALVSVHQLIRKETTKSLLVFRPWQYQSRKTRVFV